MASAARSKNASPNKRISRLSFSINSGWPRVPGRFLEVGRAVPKPAEPEPKRAGCCNRKVGLLSPALSSKGGEVEESGDLRRRGRARSLRTNFDVTVPFTGGLDAPRYFFRSGSAGLGIARPTFAESWLT